MRYGSVSIFSLFVIIISIFVWNCQGAGNATFLNSFRFMMKEHKSDLVVLLETHISGKKANEFIRKTNFLYSHRIEAEGFARGIWLMWNDFWNIHVLENNCHFAHVRVLK